MKTLIVDKNENGWYCVETSYYSSTGFYLYKDVEKKEELFRNWNYINCHSTHYFNSRRNVIRIVKRILGKNIRIISRDECNRLKIDLLNKSLL
jgi:hypothetical protein